MSEVRISLSHESYKRAEEYAEKAEITIDEAVYELASIGLIGFEAKPA